MMNKSIVLSPVIVLMHLLGHAWADKYFVLGNTKVYTVDKSKPQAEAIAIDENGVIVAVGSDAEVKQYVNQMNGEMDYTDLNGRLILPGFQDSHIHAVEAGIYSDMCYVPEETSLGNIPRVIRNCANGGSFGDQGWIVAAGIDVGILMEDMFYNFCQQTPLSVLDNQFPNTPVVILDSLGHGALANSKAYELVGYLNMTTDPPGGKLIRDYYNSHTGIVLENAQQKFRDAAFPVSSQANKEKAYQSLKNALVQLKQNGITTVSDAGGFWRQAQTEAWTRAEADGILSVRASNAYYVYPDQSLESQRLPEKLSNNPDSLVRFDHVKIYVDGIPSLGTAALHEDYLPAMELPQGEERGFEYFGNAETLNRVSKTLSDAGFQLFFHTCGDRAVTLALDAIAYANPTKQARVTHNYLVSENDYNRFKSLNTVADFQLAPSSVDLSYQNFLATTIVGPSRAVKVLPALELYNAGASITLSSDWDADVLSPLVKMKTVLNRPGGRSLPNLETVIEMMTLNPAKLLNHDDKTGSIKVGKYADLAILDRDIFQMPTSQIDSAKVLATLLQGEVIYDLNNVFVSSPDDPDDPEEEECIDSILQMRVWRKGRACSWVRENVNTRCAIRGVASHCPFSCDKPDLCTKDSSRRFQFVGSTKWKGCAFVGRRAEKRCKKQGVRNTCRQTCQGIV